jgi:hypothetical protein
MIPASAGAHPEACAETGAFTGGPSADWFADWTSENEGCMSAAAVNGFGDSGARLAAGETDGTDNLTLLSNTPKPAPFEVEADFNSDLSGEGTGRGRMHRRGRDLRHPQPGAAEGTGQHRGHELRVLAQAPRSATRAASR